jgi:molecular chaperone DnaK
MSGVPQIEVVFDIDKNGILKVTAKDLGTGKEQKIEVQSSSGLSDADVDRMTKEAEQYAEEDKKRREVVDTKNEAEAFANQIEKQMQEHGDKVEADEKSQLESAVAAVREAIKGDELAPIKSAMDDLRQTASKMAERLYAGAQGGPGGAAGGAHDHGAPPPSGDDAGKKKKGDDDDDDVIDANFTVKD